MLHISEYITLSTEREALRAKRIEAALADAKRRDEVSESFWASKRVPLTQFFEDGSVRMEWPST